MPRTFAYLRVSTTGQTTDNQLQELAAAGFKVESRRVVTETVSGNVAASQRRGFTRLLDRLEPGDVLVVTKLDRLGRSAMDVGSTIAKLAELGIRAHCLALGGVDLTSSTGKLTMNVIKAVAEFERDLLVERTQVRTSSRRATNAHGLERLQRGPGPAAPAGDQLSPNPARAGRCGAARRRRPAARARRTGPALGRVRRHCSSRTAAGREARVRGTRADLRQTRPDALDARRPAATGVDHGTRRPAQPGDAGPRRRTPAPG